MSVDKNTYLHANLHAYTHACPTRHAHTYTSTHVYINTYTYTYTFMHVCLCTCYKVVLRGCLANKMIGGLNFEDYLSNLPYDFDSHVSHSNFN